MAQAQVDEAMVTIVLSPNLRALVIVSTDISFVVTPDDPKCVEHKFTFKRNVWDKFVSEGIPLITEWLNADPFEATKANLVGNKYAEVKDSKIYGKLALLSTFSWSGKPNYNQGVKFTMSEWSNLNENLKVISDAFAHLEGRKATSLKEIKKNTPKMIRMYTWNWNPRFCQDEALTSVQTFFTKKHAEENAMADPAIAKSPDSLVVYRVEKEDCPAPVDFLRYAYLFLMNHEAVKLSAEKGDEYNFYDCLPIVNIQPHWMYMMFSQFHLTIGLRPVETAEQCVATMLGDTTRDEMVTAAQAFQHDHSAFYLMCKDLYKDIQNGIPMDTY